MRSIAYQAYCNACRVRALSWRGWRRGITRSLLGTMGPSLGCPSAPTRAWDRYGAIIPPDTRLSMPNKVVAPLAASHALTMARFAKVATLRLESQVPHAMLAGKPLGLPAEAAPHCLLRNVLTPHNAVCRFQQ